MPSVLVFRYILLNILELHVHYTMPWIAHSPLQSQNRMESLQFCFKSLHSHKPLSGIQIRIKLHQQMRLSLAMGGLFFFLISNYLWATSVTSGAQTSHSARHLNFTDLYINTINHKMFSCVISL